ncbi:Ig-like domain-containing protein, partial [Pseudomonas sp. D(2018)]|uniref:Ig-like domain-containing protein n=1 Tax=Pseudomonas sp. D(2018) TaxID=2502238 RepID=UPI0010F51F50
PVPTATYTVTDGTATDTAELSFGNVTPVDDASVLVADTNTVAEDNPATGNVLGNDGDVDNTLSVASFSVSGVTGTFTAGSSAVIAGVGTLAIAANGNYTFTPVQNWNGEVPQVTYTTNTGSESTLNITVTPVDDASALVADTNTVAEDNPASGNVLGNDSDVDNTLTVASFSVAGVTGSFTAGSSAVIAGVGTLTIATNGNYTFTPAANWNGEVPQVTYVTNTGSESTLDITVTPVDDASVVAPDTDTVTEDNPATGNVLGNDSDVDNTLSVASFSVAGITGSFTAGSSAVIAGVGTLTIAANGNYTFTPATNWNGEVPQVTYVTNTGSESTLNITVTPVNDAPLASNDGPIAVTEDTPVNGNVLTNDSDIDGDSLTVTQFEVDGTTYAAGQTATITGIGSLVINANGSFTFTPALNYNGPVPTATYTVTDGTATDTAELSFGNVTPVDDASVLVADTNTVAEDNPASGNVLGNDSDVDNTLSVASFSVAGVTGSFTAGSSAVIAGVGTLTIAANGNYTFTPAANWNGEVPQVTYVTNTGSSSTLDITVTPVDDASVVAPDTNTVAEDNPASGNVLGNDSDVDNTLSVASFSINGVTGSFTAGSSAVIAGVGTLTIATNGNYTFTPVANWNGEVPQVTYVTNTGSESTLDITVTPVNDAPLATNDGPIAVTEDTPAIGNVLTNDSDPENDTLTVTQFEVDGTTYTAGQTATITGVGSLVINANGSFTFTPALNYNGPVPTATYTVTDGTATDTAELSFGNVTPVDDASVLIADTNTVAEDNPATGNVLGNDSDVDNTLTVASFSVAGVTGSFTAGSSAVIAGVGTLAIAANGNYTFTPVANWNGDVPQVTYTTNTGSESTLDITVTPVDDASALVADTNTVAEDNPATGNVLGNDSDVDNTLSVASFSVAGVTGSFTAGSSAVIAGVGTLTIAANGNYTFTPVANWDGEVPQVTYVTNTGSSSTLDITVTPVNDAPNIVDATVSLNENVPANTQVIDVNDSFTSNDRDVDGQAISYSITGGNGSGIFVINPATGVISIAPGKTLDYETARQHVLTVTASDGTLIDTAQVTVNVNNLPDTLPTVTGGSKAVSETGLRSSTDADTSNMTTGQVTITHDSATTVTLVAPTGTTLSSGDTNITWSLSANGKTLTGSAGTEPVITISIDDQGNYSVNLLKPIDHPDTTSADVLNLNVGVKVKDVYNNEGSGTLTVQIKDDVPTAEPGGISIDIPVSSINLSGLEAGFVNVRNESGGTSSINQSNLDSDSYSDKLTWGTGSNPSGYVFADNEALRASGPSLPDSDFKLGTFTHNNFPVSGTSLGTVDLVVKLTVMIDGVPTTIEHTVRLQHTETPNSGATQNPANDDIIRLDNSTLVKQFTVGNRTFEFEIKGFLDPSTGNVVTTIYTTENASSSFDLYAVVKSTDGLPLDSGDISTVTTTGADGDVLVSGSEASVAWAGATQQADGSFTITNEFGTFTGWADGRYRFEVSREARDNFNADQIENLRFDYTVTDGDGDTAHSNVTVTLNGEKVLPFAPVVEQAAQSAVLSAEVGTQATASLGIEVGRDSSGASVKITAADDSSLDGQAVQGTVLVGGVATNATLTSGGVALVYRANADGSLDAIKQGTNDVVFKVTGNAADGSYSVQMLGTLDRATSTQSDSSSLTFSQTSQGAQAASNTSNFTVSLSGTNGNAYWSGSRLGVDSSSNSDDENREINYRNGNANEVLVLTFAAIAGVTITSVQLSTRSLGSDEELQYRVNGGQWQTVDGSWSSPDVNISISNAINTIEIRAGNDDTDFSIDAVNVGYTKTVTADIDSTTTLNLGATVTDGSGDKASTDFSVVIDPDNTLDGTNSNDSLMGSSQGDTLHGGVGDDLLNGGNGHDTLYGGEGKDILIGGQGDDILWGQGAADTFTWKSGDAGIAGNPAQDVVKDFKLSEGDKIDLSDLLQGETTASIDNFLKLIVDTGTGNATLLVSKEGHLNDDGGAASHADLAITLEGAANQLSGASINSLIAGADPTIKIDHS